MLENFFVSVNILKSSKLLPNGEERNNLKIWKQLKIWKNILLYIWNLFIVAKVMKKNIKFQNILYKFLEQSGKFQTIRNAAELLYLF